MTYVFEYEWCGRTTTLRRHDPEVEMPALDAFEAMKKLPEYKNVRIFKEVTS